MPFEDFNIVRPSRVCLCRNVSKEDLHHAYKNGAKTLEKLIQMTGASTGCTSCLEQVTAIFNKLADNDPNHPPEKKLGNRDSQLNLPLKD